MLKAKMNVLFTHARDQFLAPSQVHSLFMRYLDRERVVVHLACAAGVGGEKSPALKMFETIPNVHLRPTQFGPSITGRSKIAIIRSVISTGLPSIGSLAGLVRYIKRYNISIIHSEYKPRDAFYGVLLAKLAGSKMIVHVHSAYADWVGGRVRWAMKQADGIVVISEFVAQSVIAAGFSPEKVYCIPNGVDPDAWNYATDKNLVREEFGLTPEIPLLVMISRLDPQKGHKLLLQSLAVLKDQVPDIKLLIVGGEGPGADGLYSSDLKQSTHELNLDEHVIFAGPRSDVQQILAASDIFVMPASGEGFGLSFVEAMAMKKPVIALDDGAAPEVVEHGKSGMLSPAGDVQQLAENILALVKNPVLCEQMGEYGRMRVEQYFNPQRMAHDVEQMYQRILEGTKAPGERPAATIAKA